MMGLMEQKIHIIIKRIKTILIIFSFAFLEILLITLVFLAMSLNYFATID